MLTLYITTYTGTTAHKRTDSIKNHMIPCTYQVHEVSKLPEVQQSNSGKDVGVRALRVELDREGTLLSPTYTTITAKPTLQEAPAAI